MRKPRNLSADTIKVSNEFIATDGVIYTLPTIKTQTDTNDQIINFEVNNKTDLIVFETYAVSDSNKYHIIKGAIKNLDTTPTVSLSNNYKSNGDLINDYPVSLNSGILTLNISTQLVQTPLTIKNAKRTTGGFNRTIVGGDAFNDISFFDGNGTTVVFWDGNDDPVVPILSQGSKAGSFEYIDPTTSIRWKYTFTGFDYINPNVVTEIPWLNITGVTAIKNYNEPNQENNASINEVFDNINAVPSIIDFEMLNLSLKILTEDVKLNTKTQIYNLD